MKSIGRDGEVEVVSLRPGAEFRRIRPIRDQSVVEVGLSERVNGLGDAVSDDSAVEGRTSDAIDESLWLDLVKEGLSYVEIAEIVTNYCHES